MPDPGQKVRVDGYFYVAVINLSARSFMSKVQLSSFLRLAEQ